MQFSHPQFLALIVPVLAWTWWCARKSIRKSDRRHSLQSTMVRSIILTIVVLALAEPHTRETLYARRMILIPDKSLRLANWTLPRAESFATELKPEFSNDLEVTQLSSDSILDSVYLAAETATSESASHLIIFTDGHTTPTELQTAASRLHIPISVVPIESLQEDEWAISELRVPSEVRPGETFEVEVELYSVRPISAQLDIYFDSIRIHNETITVSPDRKTHRVPCTAPETRVLQVEARLSSASEDRISVNNRMSAAIAVRTRPTVLIVSRNELSVSAMRSAIEAQLIQSIVREPRQLPARASDCIQFDAIVLSNVSASELSDEQVEALRQYVTQFGGGLIVCGGDRSFSAGGYANSPLNDLLPVNSQQEDSEDRPTRAIALLLDKSASMNGDKLDMAGKAAASVVKYLKHTDELAVIGFDAVPHIVIPLQRVHELEQPEELIRSLGANGGTTLNPAIEAAFEMLSRSQSSQRHIILLTDGTSTDQDTPNMISEMSEKGMTLSAISIGDDADQELLRTLSEAGRGRFWQTTNPTELPSIVLQDADGAGTQGLQTDPFTPVFHRLTPVLKDRMFQPFPVLEGIVRTSPRSQADLILSSEDGVPVLAWWQAGLGTVIAFTSDIEGRWTATWESWPSYPRFWSQIIRYAGRELTGEDLDLTFRRDEQQLHVLVAEPSDLWAADSQEPGEVRWLAADGTLVRAPLTHWDRQHWTASTELPHTGFWIAEAEVRSELKGTMKSRPVPIVIDPDEAMRPRTINEQILKEIAATTGGLYDPKPEELLRMTADPGMKHESAREELYCLAAILWVADVIMRRVIRRGRA